MKWALIWDVSSASRWRPGSNVPCRYRQRGATTHTLLAPPSGSAQRRPLWDAGGMFEAGSLEGPRCWDNVHGHYSLSLQYNNTSAFGAVEPFWSTGPWSRCASLRVSVCRSSSHGSWRMAALFRDSTMKTNVFLLLFAAIACRLARCDPNPVEELQVETLVSKTSVSPPQLETQ